VVHLNRGGHWLAATLMPALLQRPGGAPLNMLALLTDPEGFTRHIVNLHAVGPPTLQHLRDQALLWPALTPQVEAFAALLRDRLGASILQAGVPRPGPPLLTTRFSTHHGELAFISMFTTFGTPQDITLASLRLEHLFAADEATRAVMQTHV
jgi:MmyB-like transcription regulator ligand binding domain